MHFAVVVAVSTATTAVLPAWRVLRHTDCGLNGASHGVMVWGVSFDACLAKASTEAKGGFMYTNERWHGSTGCSTGLARPTNASCGSAGPDGNWDSYFCEAPDGKCATPVAPPQPPPPTPCPNITTQANCTAQSHRCAWNSDPHGGHCAVAPLSPTTEPCSAPGLLSTDGPNILTIGDSISMCGFGYGHFVNDMLVAQTQGRLAGYSSACGQMASTADSAHKMANCIGNSTGTLKGRPFSVITYNAGLHDCDTAERIHADAYRVNLKAGLEVLKGAAHAVAVTTTTPFDINIQKPDADAGINMSCVLEYNVIAKEVAAEVGVSVVDLYAYVEEFCQQGPGSPNAKWPPLLPSSSGYGGNYTACAIQSSGLHFFTSAPQPSGQQYTGLHIAAEVIRRIPNAHINNRTEESEATRGVLERVSNAPTETLSCGNHPAPLSTTLPNVLIIGDSISEPGSGYGPGVEQLLMRPGLPWRNQSGPLASVQHNGNTGSNQAGATTNGVNCIKSWVGNEKWDVITMNFGIHDCCPPNENVTQTQYIKNLGIIYETAHAALAPGGKILWVSTTPVPTVEGAAPQSFTCGRSGSDFNSCIDDYNAAALELLSSKPDVKVFDLNEAVSAVCGRPYETCNLQLWHNVHFTTAGKQFCAVQVAHAVAPLLAPKWHTLCSATGNTVTCPNGTK